MTTPKAKKVRIYKSPPGPDPLLDAIVDKVLHYRPKAKSKPAVQRKRRKTLLAKKRAQEK